MQEAIVQLMRVVEVPIGRFFFRFATEFLRYLKSVSRQQPASFLSSCQLSFQFFLTRRFRYSHGGRLQRFWRSLLLEVEPRRPAFLTEISLLLISVPTRMANRAFRHTFFSPRATVHLPPQF